MTGAAWAFAIMACALIGLSIGASAANAARYKELKASLDKLPKQARDAIEWEAIAEICLGVGLLLLLIALLAFMVASVLP